MKLSYNHQEEVGQKQRQPEALGAYVLSLPQHGALPAFHACLLGAALDEDAVCLLEAALPCVICLVLWKSPGAAEHLECGSNVCFNIW